MVHTNVWFTNNWMNRTRNSGKSSGKSRCQDRYVFGRSKVSIGDPRADDCPLVAVSDEFEVLTGYSREEPCLHWANPHCESRISLISHHNLDGKAGGFTLSLSNLLESFFLRSTSIYRSPCGFSSGNHWQELPLPGPKLSTRFASFGQVG